MIEEYKPDDAVIKKEVRRLKRIYKDLEGKKKQAAEGLIVEAAFMRGTLTVLKQFICEEGPIDEMKQGEYSILREHPAARTYNSMIQRYMTICKQLTDLLPKEVEKPPEDDEFDNFRVGRED